MKQVTIKINRVIELAIKQAKNTKQTEEDFIAQLLQDVLFNKKRTTSFFKSTEELDKFKAELEEMIVEYRELCSQAEITLARQQKMFNYVKEKMAEREAFKNKPE